MPKHCPHQSVGRPRPSPGEATRWTGWDKESQGLRSGRGGAKEKTHSGLQAFPEGVHRRTPKAPISDFSSCGPEGPKLTVASRAFFLGWWWWRRSSIFGPLRAPRSAAATPCPLRTLQAPSPPPLSLTGLRGPADALRARIFIYLGELAGGRVSAKCCSQGPLSLASCRGLRDTLEGESADTGGKGPGKSCWY